MSPSGELDALVNNAGHGPRVSRADILEASEESFEELMRTNVQGPYFLTQEVARRWLAAPAACRSTGRPQGRVRHLHLRRDGVGRAAAITACPRPPSPWLPSSGRPAWLPEGIQAYEVRPGIMLTDMTSGVKAKYDALIAQGLVPQGRWGDARGRRQGGTRPAGGEPSPSPPGGVFDVDGGFHISRL